jgi:hypothetical protein
MDHKSIYSPPTLEKRARLTAIVAAATSGPAETME